MLHLYVVQDKKSNLLTIFQIEFGRHRSLKLLLFEIYVCFEIFHFVQDVLNGVILCLIQVTTLNTMLREMDQVK